jgi:hypothetical protein
MSKMTNMKAHSQLICIIVLFTTLLLISCHPKILKISKATSPDKINTVTIIDCANDGGFDYQLIRYIYLQDTNKILRNNINHVALPDNGVIEVAWESNEIVNIYIEEQGLIFSNDKEIPISDGKMTFANFSGNITMKIFCRSLKLNRAELMDKKVKIYTF